MFNVPFSLREQGWPLLSQIVRIISASSGVYLRGRPCCSWRPLPLPIPFARQQFLRVFAFDAGLLTEEAQKVTPLCFSF